MPESNKEDCSNIDSWTSEPSEFEIAEEDILTYGRANLNSSLLENILVRYKKFTPVQRKAIPVVLSGRDVLVKSQTGSGKTLAALIPLLNLTLEKSGSFGSAELKFLIVVPSNDLVHQVTDLLKILLKKLSKKVTFKGVSDPQESLANVVVTKPSVAAEIAKGKELLYLLVDEADLLFEFGYKSDTLKLVELLRTNSKFKSFQTVFLSATLEPEIKNIANLLLYKPVYLDIPFTEDVGTVNEFYILVEEKNKLVTLYLLLKMESIPYGSIIFVNSNKKGYHLFCFLRKLSLEVNIVSKLLSPKLRHSILQSFNQGLLGCLILVDEENQVELNLSRGVDFKNVKCVINFDEPKNLEIYKHRIGRTGRNYQKGSSLTFFTKSDNELLLQLTKEDGVEDANDIEEDDELEEEYDEEVEDQLDEEDDDNELGEDDALEDLEEDDDDNELEEDQDEELDNDDNDNNNDSDQDLGLTDYEFDGSSGLKRLMVDQATFESFKYRINDVLKSITPKLVETAQIQSVRQSALEQEEFLKSIKENELILLKSVLKKENQLLKPEKKHLVYIPKYLVDGSLQKTLNNIKHQIYPENASKPSGKNHNLSLVKREKRAKLALNGKGRGGLDKRGRRDRKRKYFRKKLPRFKRKKK